MCGFYSTYCNINKLKVKDCDFVRQLTLCICLERTEACLDSCILSVTVGVSEVNMMDNVNK